MRLQVVYTEVLESPRLFQRKTLNSTQDKGSLTAWFWRQCKCQQKLILLQRNEAVNKVRLVPRAPVVSTWSLYFLRAFLVACRFGATGLSLEEQVHAEHCYRLESLSLFGSLYPAERSGFLQGQGAIAAEFWNVLTELLQTGWLTRCVWRN